MFEKSEHFKTPDDIHQATIPSVVEMMGLSGVVREDDLSYLTLCPFHNEDTPSFGIRFDKGFYYCYGCSSGGSIAKLFNKRLGISMLQAIVLAEFIHPGVIENKPKILQRLPEVSLAQYPLMTNATYLWRRNIRRRETLRAFDVRYDAIRKRIVIPIRHVDGALVGFVDRRTIEEKEEGPKYIHNVNAKTLTLFNLIRAVQAKSKSVVVVEGPLDVLRAYDAGYPYCVATLGGSISLEQANLLRQNVDRAATAFDNDKNGPLYAVITDERLAEVGIETRRLTIPKHRKDLGECTNAEIALILRGGITRGKGKEESTKV